MGYYLNKTRKGPLDLNKVEGLVEDGAEVLKVQTFGRGSAPEYQPNLVCVVDNGPFEAALYVFSQEEYNYVTRSPDTRTKTWLKYDFAKELSA